MINEKEKFFDDNSSRKILPERMSRRFWCVGQNSRPTVRNRRTFDSGFGRPLKQRANKAKTASDFTVLTSRNDWNDKQSEGLFYRIRAVKREVNNCRLMIDKFIDWQESCDFLIWISPATDESG
jgi:hypothetical protein